MPEIDVFPDKADAFMADVARKIIAEDVKEQKQSEDLQTAAETVDQDPESWMTAASWSVDFVDKKFCPAWQIDAGEKEALAKSLADVLDLYLPGAMAGFDNWHPVFRLVGTLGMISAMRIDFKTWQLAPLHEGTKEAHDESKPAGRQLDLNGGDDQEREKPRRFTTDGD